MPVIVGRREFFGLVRMMGDRLTSIQNGSSAGLRLYKSCPGATLSIL
jgi:hypothetical protein